jgi:hypothetical protein
VQQRHVVGNVLQQRQEGCQLLFAVVGTDTVELPLRLRRVEQAKEQHALGVVVDQHVNERGRALAYATVLLQQRPTVGTGGGRLLQPA